MALLTPPDVVPEAMRFLVRAVLAFSGATCSREELIALVAPEGLVEAMASIGTAVDTGDEGVDDPKTGGVNIANESLEALKKLGLVGIEHGIVTAAETVTNEWRAPLDVTARSFARAVRRSLWRVALNVDHSEDVADLVQALALLSAAPEPLQPFDGFDEPTANRRFVDYQIERFGRVQAEWAVGNIERWRAFRRFAPYVGLAVPVATKVGARVSARGVVADCSYALAEELAGLEPRLYDMSSFIDICAAAVPVLDTGELATPDTRPAEELSGGLSLSLRQLEAGGLLALVHESDAGTRVVTLGADPGLREVVSHVRWNPPIKVSRRK